MTWEMPLIVGAYFIGSVPFGYILARAVRGVDIRTVGSGNIGATNVGRIMGRGWGLFVFALDVLKGLLPAYIGKELGGPELAVLGGLAVIIGHNWPIFLGFRGGKGVATSCGVLLAVFPPGLFISLGLVKHRHHGNDNVNIGGRTLKCLGVKRNSQLQPPGSLVTGPEKPAAELIIRICVQVLFKQGNGLRPSHIKFFERKCKP